PRDAVLGISVQNRHYGIFAPAGTTWSHLAMPRWTADTSGKNYFAVAVLPDDRPETLEVFRKYAYAQVADTGVAWEYDAKRCAVETTFKFTTKSFEGNETGTLFALYPHQWTNTNTPLLDKQYPSVRGPMKLCAGGGFRTVMAYPGVLPALPL